MSGTILIVDDEDGHRSMLKTVLGGWGYQTEEAIDGNSAIQMCSKKIYDAILSDIRMAEIDDGLTAMKTILEDNPNIPVIMMTGYSSIESVIEALRFRAYDYLTKPLDFEKLKITLAHALEHSRLKSENQILRETILDQSILGTSQAMHDVMNMLRTIAPSDATVLITGESGTGKELVAKELQSRSNRKDKPFITINCAALTETLLESELFGYEKGAFTGAEKRREGRFVQANGGTLFLDEIGELPMTIQAKLLRALQQGEIQRLGSDVTLNVDVRIIAATNKNIQAEIKEGRFREDLYYRLNVINLDIPPLRDRREDIPILAINFLQRFSVANNKNLKSFTKDAMTCLTNYSWPGNVRELENTIERAVILCATDTIDVGQLPMNIRICLNMPQTSTTYRTYTPRSSRSSKSSTSRENASNYSDDNKNTSKTPNASTIKSSMPMQIGEEDYLANVEKNAIIAMLQATNNNKSEAARRLGITRVTLHNKIKVYGIIA